MGPEDNFCLAKMSKDSVSAKLPDLVTITGKLRNLNQDVDNYIALIGNQRVTWTKSFII